MVSASPGPKSIKIMKTLKQTLMKGMKKAGAQTGHTNSKNNKIVSESFPKEQRLPTRCSLKMAGVVAMSSFPPAMDIAALMKEEFSELQCIYCALHNYFNSNAYRNYVANIHLNTINERKMEIYLVFSSV